MTAIVPRQNCSSHSIAASREGTKLAMPRTQFLHITAVSLLLLAACEKTVTFQIPLDEDLKLTIHDTGPGIITAQECMLEAGSDEIDKIATWLNANKDDWEPSVVTFVPGVMVRGPDFTLNFLGDGAILNYEKGQFTSPSGSSFYSNLRCDEG